MPQFHPSMILFKDLVIKQKPLPTLKENFSQNKFKFFFLAYCTQTSLKL